MMMKPCAPSACLGTRGQLLLLGKDTPDEPWLRVQVPDTNGIGPSITTFVNQRYLVKALTFGLNSISLIDPMSPLFSQRRETDDRDAIAFRRTASWNPTFSSTTCRYGCHNYHLSATS